MRYRFVVIAVVVLSASCSGASDGPSAPTPTSTRVLRLSGNLAFGDVQVGDVRTDGTLVITNEGNASLSVTGISSPDSVVYVLSWTNGTIVPGGSQTINVRFAPKAEQSYSGIITVTGDQTSGMSTIAVTGTGTRPPRRGSVTDPVGDPRPYLGVPAGAILTDLEAASIDIAGGMVTISISFARGTLSASDVNCQVMLDTDENPSTGAALDPTDPSRIGADYVVTFVSPRGSTHAAIDRRGSTSTLMGSADVVFPAADQARISFPISFLDYDDGRLAFKVRTFYTDPAGNAGVVDIMPSSGVPAGVTR